MPPITDIDVLHFNAITDTVGVIKALSNRRNCAYSTCIRNVSSVVCVQSFCLDVNEFAYFVKTVGGALG